MALLSRNITLLIFVPLQIFYCPFCNHLAERFFLKLFFFLTSFFINK